MSKTVKLKLSGSLHWAKVFPFNREMHNMDGELIRHKYQKALVPDGEEGEYRIDIHVTREELAKVAKAGARNKPRMDKETGFPKEFEDGYSLNFRRLHCVPKAPAAGGPPKVRFADGTAFDPEVHGLIGNGTKGEIVVRVDHFKGKDEKGRQVDAARSTLEEVIIHDLIKYGGNDDDGGTPAPASPPPADTLNDDIPF